MIGRFPKMVVLQYARAKRLGYKENLARAFGYAVAQKYAIFKNTSNKNKKKNRKIFNNKWFTDNIKENIAQLEHRKDIEYQKDQIFKISISSNKYPVVKDVEITEQDFNKYLSKFNQEILNNLGHWASKIVFEYDEKVLRNENKFFNEVWKKHRDDKL